MQMDRQIPHLRQVPLLAYGHSHEALKKAEMFVLFCFTFQSEFMKPGFVKLSIHWLTFWASTSVSELL